MPSERQDDLRPRSTDADDYQALPQSVGAMAKTFADGHVIAPHAHARDQLLHSTKGVMRLLTDHASLVVPPDRAVQIPAGLRHSVHMHGAVEMRTLYIVPDAAGPGSTDIQVFAVSPLLRALIVALCDEPVQYAPGSRGDLIAQLVVSEIRQATEVAFSAPLPRDPRLQKLCAALIAAPGDRRTLTEWADSSGASSRTLARLFESELGMGFVEWRRRIRFHHAIDRLNRGDAIDAVAHAVGYKSASAFSAAFRAVMGAQPSKALSE